MKLKASSAGDEDQIVYTRVSPELYEKLDRLKVELHARGISTVIRQILETAFSDGITVADSPESAQKTKQAAA